MWLPALLATFFSIICVGCFKSCDGRAEKAVCEVPVSSEPIVHYILTQRLGISLQTCLNVFDTFDWSVGVYCPSVQFCGLGLDISLDYSTRWNRKAFLPSKHECFLITDIKVATCAELNKQLTLASLFSRK